MSRNFDAFSQRSAIPALPAALIRRMLPLAERDEVMEEIEREFSERASDTGIAAARRWFWWQAMASTPALLRRSWWRGMTGFEPDANRMRPGGPSMESWIIDARYALRRLRNRPSYTMLAVLTLALGVGGAAAITGVVRALLFSPLPYHAEEEIGVFWNQFDWSEEEFLHLRPEWPGFRQVAMYTQRGVALRVGDSPPRLVPGVTSSAELFDVLGRPPLLGRTFAAGDDVSGAEPVAVLSHGLWQELGGEPAMVGSRVQLDGVERTVVGVMPRGFWFPDPAVRVWVARQLDPENAAGNYALVGRVPPGTRMDGLAPQLERTTSRLAERFEYPEQFDKTKNAAVTPVRDYLVGSLRPALLATLGAMGMILLIACANVASLMLGQVDGRATEFAVRSALGAERRRMLQQLVAESVMIGLAAGVVGAAVAAGGFRLLLGALPLGVWAQGATLDWAVFLAAILTALMASLLISIVPVVSLWRGDLRGALSSSRTSGIGGRGGRMESGLVVTEVALAVLMAAGAGLLMRSVSNLYSIDPGVATRGTAVVDVAAPAGANAAARREAYRTIAAELQSVPGVRSVAYTSKLPLTGQGDNWGIAIEGRPDIPQSTTAYRVVTPGYFETIGMTLKQGRVFDETDREGGDRVVVINEALARKYFPGEDPIGRGILTGAPPAYRIIGVVADAAEVHLVNEPVPARYAVADQSAYVPQAGQFVLRVHAGQNEAAVLEQARRAVQRAAPGAVVRETTTMALIFAQAVGPARQIMALLTMLTGLAVVLGAIGVYGIISHVVSRRKREWAIRIALGLSPSHVIGRVVRQGAALVLTGIVIGIAAAMILARGIASLLHGVGTTDPLALAAASALLLMVGLMAAFLPAYRASRTHPALVLREE